VHQMPWYLRPVIPAFFNFFDSTCRWAVFYFIAASVAEMLICGLELILSVVAARLIRKRIVAQNRWIGVSIVTIGVVVVGLSDNIQQKSNTEEDEDDEGNNHFVGIGFVLAKVVAAVSKDLSEEIFMQVADFPATLLLGMEGLYGLLFAIPLYLTLGSYLGENPSDTWEKLTANDFMAFLPTVGLVLLFTVAGIFNILATGVTSAMTRNVWKMFRIVLVWIFGLIIYYSSGQGDLGEEWTIPNSFVILLGFGIMMVGTRHYYKT
jgi:drug/metabolite transporter (DMT)-like permease